MLRTNSWTPGRTYTAHESVASPLPALRTGI